MDALSQVFSYSKLSLYAMCPRKFWLRYVMRKREERAPLIFGQAAHASMDYDNTERIAGRDPSEADCLEVAVAKFEAEGGEGKDDFAKVHAAQIKAYRLRGLRAKIQPVPGTVEAFFRVGLTVPKHPLEERTWETERVEVAVEGFVDVVSQEDGRRVVVDYKTAGRPWTPAQAESSPQLSLYELGAQADGSRILSLVKYQKQKPTARTTPVVDASEARRQKLLAFCADTIVAIRESLRTGNFPKCSPGAHYCSPTACAFYGLCYGKQPVGFVQLTGVEPAGTLEAPEWRK